MKQYTKLPTSLRYYLTVFQQNVLLNLHEGTSKYPRELRVLLTESLYIDCQPFFDETYTPSLIINLQTDKELGHFRNY